MLMVAMAAENARKWRGWRALVWLISGLIALGLATQTKQSSLLAMPALLCLLAPTWGTRVQFAGAHRFVRALLNAAFFVFILSALASCDFLIWLIRLEKVLHFFQEQGLPVPRRDWEFFREAMASQLLSPGGSFWGSSPILLLAVPGAYLLWRRGGRRHLWAATLILLSYAVGHAMRRPSLVWRVILAAALSVTYAALRDATHLTGAGMAAEAPPSPGAGRCWRVAGL